MHSQYTEVLQIFNVLFWMINYNKNERWRIYEDMKVIDSIFIPVGEI